MGQALTLLLALQAATAEPAPPPMARIDFDLAKVQPAELGCEEGRGEEIIVCGRVRGPVNRFTPEEMEALARVYADKPVRAETGLGGDATGALVFSPVEYPGGGTSNRIMVGIGIPF